MLSFAPVVTVQGCQARRGMFDRTGYGERGQEDSEAKAERATEETMREAQTREEPGPKNGVLHPKR